MLVFGHTSYYWWKKNPYGEVFANIAKLNEWDTIQLIWEWKLYDYDVISKSVHRPKFIADQYKKYTDWKYITLMWCYPIWMTSQRILVVAKQKELSHLSKN
jgi:sortase (surface protein transpeptidase)